MNLENIIFHNNTLSKAKIDSKVETITYYFQQLCQLDNVIMVVGSGFSKHLGGPLMSNLSEKCLAPAIVAVYKKVKNLTRKRKSWNDIWGIDHSLEQEILKQINKKNPDFSKLQEFTSNINIETKINELKTIKDAYRLLNSPDKRLVDTVLGIIKEGIIKQIKAVMPCETEPTYAQVNTKLLVYRNFLKKLINYRRPQQPRIKIFTTNYDKVIETACDLEGIQCVTGFDGQSIRIFNPTNFDLNISYKATGQSSVYYSKVVHLYKLHGSIHWQKKKIDDFDEIIQSDDGIAGNIVIYPCATKYSETLEMPYGEMFRRFGDSVATPQTAIFTIGYGFNDEHVNQMLIRSLKNPSCQLICIEPKAVEDYENADINSFLKKLIQLSKPIEGTNEPSESRICVIGGTGASFPDISEIIAPETKLEDPNEEVKKLISKLIALGNANA